MKCQRSLAEDVTWEAYAALWELRRARFWLASVLHPASSRFLTRESATHRHLGRGCTRRIAQRCRHSAVRSALERSVRVDSYRLRSVKGSSLADGL